MASQPITKAQSANQIQPEVIAIVGPTAAGKSDLAIALAQLIGAEIINADAMQLYRGMDIGTGKDLIAANPDRD